MEQINNKIINIATSNLKEPRACETKTFQIIKKKRRSKKDPTGRKFICDCGKGYLSKLALSNHIKGKHSKYKNFSEDLLSKNYVIPNKKGTKGRPKKVNEVLNYDELFFYNFFQNSKRLNLFNLTGNNRDSKVDNLKNIKNLINEIYTENNCNLFKQDNYFIKKILNIKDVTNGNNSLTIDNILIKYLRDFSERANEFYFKFMIVYVVLLRTCINKYKNVELENYKEIFGDKLSDEIEISKNKNYNDFTQIYDCEHIPEICNEFLTEFLPSENYLGYSNIEFQIEFNQLTQHFCFWLFQNNYSSLKLIVNSANL